MSRSLDDLSPVIRPKVDQFLYACKAAGIDIIVTCTLRTLDEQAHAYAQGRTMPGPIVTNAKPGTSAHNYGLAVDVVPMVNGKPDWTFNAMHPSPAWEKIGRLGRLAGLEWFGDPSSLFVEGAHFQEPHWREYLPGPRTRSTA